MSDIDEAEVRTIIESLVAEPFFRMDSDDERNTLRLVLASLHLGTHTDRLAKFLGLNRDKFVRPRAKRLRDNGIWDGPNVVMDCSDDTDYSLGILLAVLVAEGTVVRSLPEGDHGEAVEPQASEAPPDAG